MKRLRYCAPVNASVEQGVNRGMGTTSGYRDLLAWQEAMKFAVMVYHVTSRFPREEIYGLTAQIRKSAVSIPSNIAEGARNSDREFHHFLGISAGSLAEVETRLDLASRLEYAKLDPATAQQAQRVGMLPEGPRRSCASAP